MRRHRGGGSLLVALLLPWSAHGALGEANAPRDALERMSEASEANKHVPSLDDSEKLEDAIRTILANGFDLQRPLCDSLRSLQETPSMETIVRQHCSVYRDEYSQVDRWLQEGEGEEEEAHDDWFFIAHALGAFACICVAALAAGLTMGLLSLDPLLLLIKMRASPSEKEREQAGLLLPLVKQHHLLLVTLLLLNSMANEALPLFLEVLVSPVVAVLLSVTFVLFFGEIIPSAVFTGPNKIALAAKMSPLVKLVMLLLYPIAFPIAKVLDVYLHHDGEDGEDGGGGGEGFFNRGELSALVRIQYEERLAAKQQRRKERKEAAKANVVGGLDFADRHQSVEMAAEIRARTRQSQRRCSDDRSVRTAASAYTHTPDNASVETSSYSSSIHHARRQPHSASIHVDEVTMVEGALAMKTKVALDVFTPLHRVFAIPYHTKLSERNMVHIYSSGYSRVPVYEVNKKKPKDVTAIRGILITKQLIVVNPNDQRPVETLPLYTPLCVSPKMNLVDLLNLFQSGSHGHLALVCARPAKAEQALLEDQPVPEDAGLMGIITIEEVLEALLQEQIYDEMDRMERDAARIARWVTRKWRAFVATKKKERASSSKNNKRVSMGEVVTHVLDDEERGEHTPLVQQSTNSNETKQRKKLFGIF